MSKRFFIILFLTILSCADAWADIVYPARIELKQIDENTFEVTFILPVIQGRVIRATPLLPCNNLTEPEMNIDSFSKTLTWQVTCSELFGKEVGLEGLGGAQVDILLQITYLNGRIIQSTLSPAKPLFIVPYPPTYTFIAGKGFTDGIRHFLSQLVMVILVLLLFPSVSFRKWLNMGACFLAGMTAGVILQLNTMLVFQSQYLYTILLIITLVVAMWRLSDKLPSFTTQWFIISALVGIASGANLVLPDTRIGLTGSENIIWISGILCGTIVGITVILIAAYHLSRARSIRRTNGKGNVTWLWYVMSIIICAILLYDLSLYLLIPLPPVSVLSALALLVCPALIKPGSKGIGLIMISAFTGGLMGVYFEYYPLLTVFPALGIIWFLITRFRSFKMSGALDTTVALTSALTAGWITASTVINTLSYPEANLMGLFVLVSLVLLLAYSIPLRLEPAAAKSYVVAIILVFVIYLYDAMPEMISLWMQFGALGKLPVPVVFLALFILGLILIPRKRKIHTDLNLAERTHSPYLVVLALAILCIPFGWLGITISSGEQMTDREAQTILNNTLTNVYAAFNLTDEDELFAQLSANVDDELIDQVYLDSRRRLNAGVREGAQVTVRDIDLISIEVRDSDGNDQVFETTWVVTARIKHLQHVHHRKNKYLGNITLRANDDTWKIARINLISEDRTIVPVSSL